jgi:hypothetical protein
VARGEDGKIVAALTVVQAIEQQVPRPILYSGIRSIRYKNVAAEELIGIVAKLPD